ncbi:sensor histidine kinase [Jiangella alba]|uniref:histidine kinase n=1 Tax=Jiangella alba TaxID=561176 RepID=A0A1H5P4B1_9ACTN|nr:histidine kinase [Jiangella alba]SEF08705.1 GAF domain-containing protein [Jiangella alba]
MNGSVHARNRRDVALWAGWAALVAGAVALAVWALRTLIDVPGELLPWALLGLAAVPVAVTAAVVPRLRRRAGSVAGPTLVFCGLALMVLAVYLVVVIGLGGEVDDDGQGVLAFSMLAALTAVVLAEPVRARLHELASQWAGPPQRPASSALETFGSRMTRAVPMDELLLQLAETLRSTLGPAGAEVWTGEDAVLERAVSVPERGHARLTLAGPELAAVSRARVSGNAWAAMWLPSLLADGGEPGGAVPAASAPDLASFGGVPDLAPDGGASGTSAPGGGASGGGASGTSASGTSAPGTSASGGRTSGTSASGTSAPGVTSASSASAENAPTLSVPTPRVGPTRAGRVMPTSSANDRRSVRVASVTHLGRLLGLLVVVRTADDRPFSDDDDRVLADLARQVGLALHNVRLDSALQASLEELRRRNAELQASRARIVSAADASRRQIERNLHDGAQQRLVALAVKLGLARRLATGDAAALLEELRTDVQETLTELRELAHGIYPPLLREHGLGEALRNAAGRATIPVRVEADAVPRYAPEAEAAVYFCCLEALQNAGKHAGPDATVTVRVGAPADGGLEFEVADDGAGFDAAAAGESHGFVNMRDRLGAFGGELTVTSAPGAGTVVAGTLPVAALTPVRSHP